MRRRGHGFDTPGHHHELPSLDCLQDAGHDARRAAMPMYVPPRPQVTQESCAFADRHLVPQALCVGAQTVYHHAPILTFGGGLTADATDMAEQLEDIVSGR